MPAAGLHGAAGHVGAIPQPNFLQQQPGVSRTGVTREQQQPQQQQHQEWQSLPQQQWIGQQPDPSKPLFDEKTAVSEAMKFPASKDDQLKWAKITSKKSHLEPRSLLKAMLERFCIEIFSPHNISYLVSLHDCFS